MTLTPNDILAILADNFTNGDTQFIGLILYSVIILAVFVLTRNLIVGFVTMIPLTLIFSYLSALPDTMMIIMLVVSVIGIALSSRKALGDDL